MSRPAICALVWWPDGIPNLYQQWRPALPRCQTDWAAAFAAHATHDGVHQLRSRGAQRESRVRASKLAPAAMRAAIANDSAGLIRSTVTAIVKQ